MPHCNDRMPQTPARAVRHAPAPDAQRASTWAPKPSVPHGDRPPNTPTPPSSVAAALRSRVPTGATNVYAQP